MQASGASEDRSAVAAPSVQKSGYSRDSRMRYQHMRCSGGEQKNRLRDGSRNRCSESPARERLSRHRTRQSSRDLRPSPGRAERYRSRNDGQRATDGARYCRHSPTNSRHYRSSFRRVSRSRSCRRASPFHRENDTRRRNDSRTRSSAYKSRSSVGQRGDSPSPKRQEKSETNGRPDSHMRSRAAPAIATIGSRESFRRATGQTVPRRCSDSPCSSRSRQSRSRARKNGSREARRSQPRRSGPWTRTSSLDRPLNRESLGVKRDQNKVNQGAMVEAKCPESERACVGAHLPSRSRSLRSVSASGSSEVSGSRQRVVPDDNRNSTDGAAHFVNQTNTGDKAEQAVDHDGVHHGESQEKGEDVGEPQRTAAESDSAASAHELVGLGRRKRVRSLDREESINRQSLPPRVDDESQALNREHPSTTEKRGIADHAAPCDVEQGKRRVLQSLNAKDNGQQHGMESSVARNYGRDTSEALSRCADGRLVLANEVAGPDTRASELSRDMKVQRRRAFRKEPFQRERHLHHEKRVTVERANIGPTADPASTGFGRHLSDRQPSRILRQPLPVGTQYGRHLRNNPPLLGQRQQDYQRSSRRFPLNSGSLGPPLSRSQWSYPPSQWSAPTVVQHTYPVSSIQRPPTRSSPWNGGPGGQNSKWTHDMYEQIAHEPERNRKRFNLYGETLEAVD
ncbi:hypothetical protein TGGT1_262935 [Toxoplasma gondii GT1]|uniref:Uncharacterized protein n=3 Tax=Toxoplasma gondii TaxID=5811 RepID=S7W6U2_TOXGG|nr:hypothetical protein TGGT1_262935 [Toxoplasma gondii GT1]KAF4641002.1 hypothetical protein TGRH88_068100 [Toxoplasma gondii]RQX71512.1 hypothetical protein TGCAST_262935 [Toxoplasma gondii CAST]